MLIAKMPDGLPEIFRCVQGEGQNLGLPAVFIRLSTCPLQCVFCDTFYTWNWKGTPFVHKGGVKVSKDEFQMALPAYAVANKVRTVLIDSEGVVAHRNIVISGGEPLLQQKGLCEMIDNLKSDDKDWHFEVETSGSVNFTEDFLSRIQFINCSPKLESSGNSLAARNKPKVIAQILDAHNSFNVDVCFKFVTHSDTLENMKKDIDEVLNWQKEHNVPSNLIYLMPQGTTVEEIQEGTKLLSEHADHYGFKISTRLHVLVYGNKRAT